MLVWHVFRRISRAQSREKKKKVGHAVVSHMATCKHADKGKQDIDRFCWPFTNARQAIRAAVNVITRDETDPSETMPKTTLAQKWFGLKHLIAGISIFLELQVVHVFPGNY